MFDEASIPVNACNDVSQQEMNVQRSYRAVCCHTSIILGHAAVLLAATWKYLSALGWNSCDPKLTIWYHGLLLLLLASTLAGGLAGLQGWRSPTRKDSNLVAAYFLVNSFALFFTFLGFNWLCAAGADPWLKLATPLAVLLSAAAFILKQSIAIAKVEELLMRRCLLLRGLACALGLQLGWFFLSFFVMRSTTQTWLTITCALTLALVSAMEIHGVRQRLQAKSLNLGAALAGSNGTFLLWLCAIRLSVSLGFGATTGWFLVFSHICQTFMGMYSAAVLSGLQLQFASWRYFEDSRFVPLP